MENKHSSKINVGQKTWTDYERQDCRAVDISMMLPTPTIIQQSATRTDALDLFASVIGMNEKQSVSIKTPASDVIFRRETLFHFVEKEDALRERYANYIIPTLTQPYEIWKANYDDGSVRNIYIGLFESGEHFLVTT